MELKERNLTLLALIKSAKRQTFHYPHWLVEKRYRIETVFGQLVDRFHAKKVWTRDAWHLPSRWWRKLLSHLVAVLFCHRSDGHFAIFRVIDRLNMHVGLVRQIMNIDYRVVFIGNQGCEHKMNIKIGADTNEHDWMRYASDEHIGAFATFVMWMSAYIQQKARKYGFSYIEMDGRSFQEIAGAVVESLGLDARYHLHRRDTACCVSTASQSEQPLIPPSPLHLRNLKNQR